MGEMTGLVVVGLVGNDVDESNAVFGQLERICVSPEFYSKCRTRQLMAADTWPAAQNSNDGRIVS